MSTTSSPHLPEAIRLARRKLVPILFLLGLVCLLDRASVGYAALTMNVDIGLSAAAFGAGAGIFFFGYVIFEVPSSLLMQRTGARVWITRIAVTWGLVMIGMSFIWDEWSFYAARLLLGIAEAGLFPAVYFLIGVWFPSVSKGRVLALFLSCSAIAGVLGGPLSALIFATAADSPIADWRILFFVLGIPAIVMGFVAYFRLPNTPQEARWLTRDQADALTNAVAAERAATGVHEEKHVWRGLKLAAKNRFVWIFCLIFFFFAMTNYGVILFLPQIVSKLSGGSPAISSLLSTIPYAIGVVALFINANHSDRLLERRWHYAIPMAIGAVGLVATGLLLDAPVAGFLALCVAVAGIMPASTLLMSRPVTVLAGATAAAGLAIINSLGSIGGFVGPYVVGFVQNTSGSLYGGLVVLAIAAAASASLTLIKTPQEKALKRLLSSGPSDLSKSDREKVA